MLTVNAITVKAANMSHSKGTWNPGVWTYQNTADYHRNASPLFFNSVKLHLAAFSFKNLVLHQENIPFYYMAVSYKDLELPNS